MKNNDAILKNDSYEVIIHKTIDEVNSNAWLLRHKKTGARVALLSNDDDNKVFNIGFRTPVSNDTGVPHIIEHTVLCGSKDFPVKDPFMEVVKGSLNTFLNAMTYPDKTVYPVASQNEKDFKNLMHIYMDAVFHPNIYNEPKIFKQEGWHFEMENEDADLIYNGIVYNEMKGVYSSIEGIMDRVTQQSLFPDTTYGNESGGDPECIPELTYEDYLDFHRKFYHPSNSFIYLYGDMDMAERLAWMDEYYLSRYDRLEIDSHIEKQQEFSKTNEVTKPYAITDGESEKDNTVLAYNWVIGDSDDVKLNYAFSVLEYALMEMPGAPLKQALIDEGIGKDVYGQYADGIRQPFYSIIAKYANEEDKDRFQETIESTLKSLVKNGLDKQALKAGLANLEFKTKEADFGRYPKGLMFGLQMFSGWLYNDERPFDYLETNAIFENLKSVLETDYFEKIIEKYFINNMHRSFVVMVPTKGLTLKKEQELAKKLAEKKAGLNQEEIEKIVCETKELKAYQEEPSTKEQLETIPLLKLSDINPDPKPFVHQIVKENETTFLYNDLFTNGIAYIDFCFNMDDIPKEYVPYVGLLKYVLGYMDTKNYKYTDLNKEIDLYLGGFSTGTGLYEKKYTSFYTLNAEIHVKALYGNISKAFELIREVICHTKFHDTKRLKEILEETKSRINAQIISSGDSAAILRCFSHITKSYYIRENMAGYSFYRFLSDILEHYEEKKTGVADKLKEVTEYAFGTKQIVLNYAGDKHPFEEVKTLTNQLTVQIPKREEKAGFDFAPAKKNEAIKTSGQVQYVARVGNYNEEGKTLPYHGSLYVLNNILRSEYLWNHIRVLGGAYGCNFISARSGNIMLSSYRDPNLKKTSDTFLAVADFIRQFDADKRDMRKFIIGAISILDRPKTVADQSDRELNLYMGETDYDMLKTERAQLLNTTVEDIRALAPLIERVLSQNNICVVGSESSIGQNKELFDEIMTLQ